MKERRRSLPGSLIICISLGVFLFFSVSACFGSEWICNCDALSCAKYDKALADSRKMPTSEKISRNLTAITVFNDNLIWKKFADAEGNDVWRVLMAFYGRPLANVGELPNPDYQLRTNKWLTAVPEAYNFFRARLFSLSRLEQLLGLPPCSNMPSIVEVWVDPVNLFRPSPDPEITDHEATLDFPWSTSKYVALNTDNMVWDDWCDPVPCKTSQLNDYGSWFINRKTRVYDKSWNGNPQTPYPWTGLGYTYDWGNERGNPVGMSEFVVVPSTVGIQRQEDVNTYFRNHSQTITVSKTGSGWVTSTPFSVFCGYLCTGRFSRYSKVTLTAIPMPGWSFAGWGGECAEAGTATSCSVRLYDDFSVSATFTR